MTIATTVDAYLAGWATVDADLTLPLPDAAWVDLSCLEADDDQDDAAAAGAVLAARTALHRARLALYDHHRALIVAEARKALAGVPVNHLAGAMLALADQTRQVRRDQALTILRGAAHGLTAGTSAWQAACDTAAEESAARGRSEAACAPAGGGPPDPAQVNAAIPESRHQVGYVTGAGWVEAQLRAQAWAVAGLGYVKAGSIREAAGRVQTSLDDLQAAGDIATDDMHATWAGAFSDYFSTGSGATLGLVAWVTEGDGRVCPDCDSNAEEGPYPADEIPDMPAHPGCRCWLELA